MKKIMFMILFVAAVMLVGCIEKDPEGLSPDEGGASTAGKAYYSSVSTGDLSGGLKFDRGWNRLTFPRKMDSVSVKKLLESVSDSYYYIYGYNERKYYFNPEERYGSYNNHSYYGKRLLKKVQPGNKYALYMANKDVLKYDPIACHKDTDCGRSYENKYCIGNKACVNGTTYSCENAGTIKSRCTSGGYGGCKPCSNGCENGACLSGPECTKYKSELLDMSNEKALFRINGKKTNKIAEHTSYELYDDSRLRVHYIRDNEVEVIHMKGIADTMKEGQTKTLKIDGKEYKVKVAIIANQENPKVKFAVNGATTDAIEEGEIYKLLDDSHIEVTELLPNYNEDPTQDIVEFYLGQSESYEIQKYQTKTYSIGACDDSSEDLSLTKVLKTLQNCEIYGIDESSQMTCEERCSKKGLVALNTYLAEVSATNISAVKSAYDISIATWLDADMKPRELKEPYLFRSENRYLHDYAWGCKCCGETSATRGGVSSSAWVEKFNEKSR